MRPTYVSLQYLRGIAALLVVFAHTTEHPVPAGVAVPFWTGRTGEIGLQVFFVISGFIISVVSGTGRFDPLDFAWRRFLRVAPLYWVCTTVLLLATLLAPAVFKSTTASWSDYILSLLFVPHQHPGDSASNLWSPLLKPGWTLNVEVFFYAITAALFWCPHRRLRAALLTLVLGSLVGLGLIGVVGGVLSFYATTNLIGFLCGVWLAEWMQDRASVEASWLPFGLGALALAVVVTIYLVPEHAAGHLAQVAAVLIVASGLLIERAGLLPRWSALKHIGDASYSLYLTHMFTVGLIWALLRRVADPTLWPVHAAGVALTTGAAVVVSLVSYRVIERPLIRFAKRSAPDQKRQAPAARLATGAGADTPEIRPRRPFAA